MPDSRPVSQPSLSLERRVLVVDDELEIRTLLTRHLTYEGMEARHASGGDEALQVLGQWQAGVVVTDITMPKMSGLELLSRVRTEYPDTRVIIMTGRTSEVSIREAMRRGADACALKPLVNLDDFVRMVRHSQAVLAHWIATLETVRERARSLYSEPDDLASKAS